MRSAPLIVVHLAGGLGNQLFQYATGRRLAYVSGAVLKLDLSGYTPEGDVQAPGLEAFRRHVRIREFNILAEPATLGETSALRDPYTGNSKTKSRIVRQLRRFKPRLGWPSTHFQERQYRFDPEVLTLRPPCYLSGFWQSEKYFADFAKILRIELTPLDQRVVDYARDYVESVRESRGIVVSVHVRRGELAVAQEKLRSRKGVFGPPTGLEYIQKATKQFDPGCKFLVFSDSDPDIAWCKENIRGGRLHFSEGHSDIQDLMIMSACDQHIIASTFSWWAAWLNDRPGRRVIAPRQWGFPEMGMVTDDLIPPTWTMI
jgi:hypothetical protein